MKRFLYHILLSLTLVLCLDSCESDDLYVFVPQDYGPHDDPPTIVVTDVRKTGSSVINRISFEDEFQRAQGMAISENVMYRFFTKGICKTYDISNIDKPIELAIFKLGSYGSNNHANSAQFYSDKNGEKYVYISGMGGKCFVEKITPTSSQLIQTILLDEIDYLKKSKRVNMICGDDGYLWLFGIDKNGTALIFARAKRPEICSGEVHITKKDIQDFWHKEDYDYYSSTSQGGKVYNGNLFFVFGNTNNDRHLDVFNIFTHKKVYSFDLNESIPEEPEDCDMYDGNIIVSVDAGRGYYVLKLQDNNR